MRYEGREKIEEHFRKYASELRVIFAGHQVVARAGYDDTDHDDKERGPFAVIPRAGERDETVDLIRRVQEYVTDVIGYEPQAARADEVIAADGAYDAQECCWLHAWLFRGRRTLHRLHEFAQMMQSMDTLRQRGAHFEVMPDEATVALRHATGTQGWNMVLAEETGVPQLRIQTADSLPHPAILRKALEKALGLAEQDIGIGIGGQVFIPAVILYRNHMDILRQPDSDPELVRAMYLSPDCSARL